MHPALRTHRFVFIQLRGLVAGLPVQVRNDAVADTLDLARRRIKKLEDMQADAQLKLDTTEVRVASIRRECG